MNNATPQICHQLVSLANPPSPNSPKNNDTFYTRTTKFWLQSKSLNVKIPSLSGLLNSKAVGTIELAGVTQFYLFSF